MKKIEAMIYNALSYPEAIKNIVEKEDTLFEFDWGITKYSIRYHDDYAEDYLMVYEVRDGGYTITDKSILMTKLLKWYILFENKS